MHPYLCLSSQQLVVESQRIAAHDYNSIGVRNPHVPGENSEYHTFDERNRMRGILGNNHPCLFLRPRLRLWVLCEACVSMFVHVLCATGGLPYVFVVLQQRVVVPLHLSACHDGRSFQKLVTLHTLYCHFRDYTQRTKAHLLQPKRGTKKTLRARTHH